MLDRADLLVSIHPSALDAAQPPPKVAILASASGTDSLLRVAFYPDAELAYCGLWHDGDLFLGGREIPVVRTESKFFIAGRIEVLGRSTRQIGLLATWGTNRRSIHQCAVEADAVIIDPGGKRGERLVLVDDPPGVMNASLLDFPDATSRERRPGNRPRMDAGRPMTPPST